MKKIFIWGFFISWHPKLVPPKNLGRLDTPILGSSLEIFDFLWTFFHQVPKKKFFFFILIENKFVLIFSSITKNYFFASPGRFFWCIFLVIFKIFDDFFNNFWWIFLVIFSVIFDEFFMDFLYNFWWIFQEFVLIF